MKIIFLDIDGVLNYGDFDEIAGCMPINRVNVQNLNLVIEETRAKIVLTTSWRHNVHWGYLSPVGFHLLLRSHGLDMDAQIVGLTTPDWKTEGRGQKDSKDWDCGRRPVQIRGWLASHAWVKDYVILDDLDMAEELPEELAARFIRTDVEVGLTPQDARRAIAILNGA